MSHSLQSAECQTASRVLPPRLSDASEREASVFENTDLASIPCLVRKSSSKPGEAPVSLRAPRGQPSSPEQDRKSEQTAARPIRVGVFGRGRLGTAIVESSEDAKDLDVLWALGRGYAPRCPVDVALDASRGEAVRDHLEWALATGADLVIGASGWEIPDLADLVGDRIGVLVASNFSLGAALLRRFSLVLGRFAAAYPEADLGISEKHHRAKTDSPSGTAKSLANALMEGCPRYRGWGSAPVEPGVLSISSLRAGYEVGYHEVLLDAPAETITLSHEARSRGLFARGALEALRWIHGRKGLFTFDDMTAELIDPLFRFEQTSQEAAG